MVTKNWRSISLLNVDYKIATRTVAGSLLGVIGSMVSPDQTSPGCLEDPFRKTLACCGISSTMRKWKTSPLPFSPSIRRRLSIGLIGNSSPELSKPMVPVLASVNASCYFIRTSSQRDGKRLDVSFFQPSCRVLQGCPLSPLMYVLCAEVLACILRSAPGISGVQLPNSAHKLQV